MTELLKKMNFKDQKEICVLFAPAEFAKELKAMEKVAALVQDLKDCKHPGFVLSFVQSEKEIKEVFPKIKTLFKGDIIVWFAYPKGTSKKYKVEISRDKGWNLLKQSGFETVRAVSIDEDWSALRFRRVEFIKEMKRKF